MILMQTMKIWTSPQEMRVKLIKVRPSLLWSVYGHARLAVVFVCHNNSSSKNDSNLIFHMSDSRQTSTIDDWFIRKLHSSLRVGGLENMKEDERCVIVSRAQPRATLAF